MKRKRDRIKRTSKWGTLLTGLGLLWIFASCESRKEALLIKDFQGQCWSIQDTIWFSWEEPDVSPVIGIDLEYAQDYPFQNLYIRMLTRGPKGIKDSFLQNDTLLSSGGEWMVPFGTLIPYGKPFELPAMESTEDQIGVIHYMRTDNLCGISSLRIVKM